MEMVERRDTSVTRHAGGWIVLGGGLLAVCLWSTLSANLASVEPSEEAGRTWPDHRFGNSVAAAIANKSTAATASAGFPRLSIDINEASEAELSCVSGVGPTLARRIVEHRRRSGRFASLEELEKIPGVGPQLLTQLTSAIIPLQQVSPPDAGSQAHHASSAPADSVQLPEQLRGGETTLAKQHFKKKTNEPLHD